MWLYSSSRSMKVPDARNGLKQGANLRESIGWYSLSTLQALEPVIVGLAE